MSIATWSSRIVATTSELPPRLLRAYRETRYRAGNATVRIGRRSAAMDRLLTRMGSERGGFITAWNPASRRLSEGANRRRQKRLAERLHRHASLPAQGNLRDWKEEHLLVAAAPSLLARIARLEGQNAVVLVRIGQPARLLMLR